MLGTTLSPVFIAFASLLLAKVTSAADGEVIPCARGNGADNGCGFCEPDKAIKVASWSDATRVPNFDMPTTGSETGGGYNVWWNIYQPDEGCRVILTEPYSTDKGSINGQLSGNVILSTTHGGCYFAQVGSRGLSAGFCCGVGDCGQAGALPGGKKKRELPMSRIARGLYPDSMLKARQWNPAPNPFDDTPSPPPPKPGVECSAATPIGDTYTKAGAQQVNGNTLNCNGGESCSISPSMMVSASTSLSNEEATTHTDSEGINFSMTAGYMFLGPTVTATGGYNKDWSDSLMKAVSTSETNTISKTLSFNIGIVPGADFNLWFTPLLRCQSFKTTCNGVDQKIEKCTPVMDGDNPTGDHGVMTVG